MLKHILIGPISYYIRHTAKNEETRFRTEDASYIVLVSRFHFKIGYTQCPFKGFNFEL